MDWHRQSTVCAVEADTAVVSATSATPRGRGPGVFDRRSRVANLVTNDPADAADVVEALITHPAVRVVNFTGSTAVGRIIAEKAGRHLKRCVLELGGKAPFVVLADADLEAAAAAASFGAFMNQGQICMSTERIIVDRSVAGEFTRLLAERAAALVVGDPGDRALRSARWFMPRPSPTSPVSSRTPSTTAPLW